VSNIVIPRGVTLAPWFIGLVERAVFYQADRARQKETPPGPILPLIQQQARQCSSSNATSCHHTEACRSAVQPHQQQKFIRTPTDSIEPAVPNELDVTMGSEPLLHVDHSLGILDQPALACGIQRLQNLFSHPPPLEIEDIGTSDKPKPKKFSAE